MNGEQISFNQSFSQQESSRSHHDVLRKHNENYAMQQQMRALLQTAHQTTSGTYVGRMSKLGNNIIPVIYRHHSSR
ncbi:uncharacterized protein VTP21DRAFT_1591 [Calcarisporiella thermophila]|uniref:uncharacterized protein n=1 Tax=Calcarisporiella thermophila TaxID=911321 RepID=UPI0037438199